MQLLILSDAHANISALRAIEAAVPHPDGIFFAGDCVDYGPNPVETIAWLREHDVHCVRGNHDQHLLNILAAGETQRVRGTRLYKWVHDNCERVSAADVAFLQGLPMHLSFEADGAAYLMQHQLREGCYDVIESAQAFDEAWDAWYTGAPMAERRMIFGHSHRQCVHRLMGDRLWLNPGSASYRRPDDRDKRAHYMLVEDGALRFGAVAYDRSAQLAAAMDYLRAGTMMETELQDAMFFFGDAMTSRSPLPACGPNR